MAGTDDLSDLLAKPVSRSTGFIAESSNVNTSDMADLLAKPLPPTTGQKAMAAAEAGAGDFTRMGAMSAGAAAGLKMTLPTANPWIIGAGVIGGGALGLYAGSEAAEGMGLRSPEDMPPELRPSGYFGSNVGGTLGTMVLPSAGAALGLRTTGQTTIGSFWNSAVNMAARYPKAFFFTEAGAGVTAGIGGYAAETMAPGQTGARIGAEVTMGFVSPVTWGTGAWNVGKSIVGGVAAKVSGDAVNNNAWKWVAETLEKHGENPVEFVRLLQQNGIISKESATAAQVTGSPAAAAIEQYLAKGSRDFANIRSAKFEESMDALRHLVVGLEQSGSPEGLRAAAEVRSVYMQTLIEARVNRANQEAVSAIQKLKGGADADPAEVSRVARNALESSLDQARTAETELWNAIVTDGAFGVDNLRAAVDGVIAKSSQILGPKKIPSEVWQLLDAAKDSGRAGIEFDPNTLLIKVNSDTGKPTTYTDLKDFRQWLLKMSREAARNPERHSDAEIYGTLADAVLKDIDAVLAQQGNKAYDTARAFSRSLNDTFTRTYAGNALAKGVYGDRIPPELLLRRATAGGEEAVNLKLSQLREATEFMRVQNLGDQFLTQANVRDMHDAQEQFIRILATSSLDSKGRINPEKLFQFAKNSKLMDQFPSVKDDITRAMKSEEGLRMWQQTADRLTNRNKERPFTAILKTGPVGAVQKAITSSRREKEIADLAQMAKLGVKDKRGVVQHTPSAMMDDLRASTMEGVIGLSKRNVTGVGQELDLGKMKSIMFDRPVNGGPPLSEILVKEGVFDQKHIDNVRKVLDAAEQIRRSATPTRGIQVEPSMTMKLGRFMSRWFGSVFASKTRGVTGSAGNIVMAGASADLGQDVLMRIPAANQIKAVEMLMANPEMLATVSARVTGTQEKVQIGKFYSWLIQSGLTEVGRSVGPTYEQEPESPTMFSQPR
jgi:hypothetical protein